MKKYKIDRYTIKIKTDKKPTSNYDTSVQVFEDSVLLIGWREKSTTPHLDIIYQVIKDINKIKDE